MPGRKITMINLIIYNTLIKFAAFKIYQKCMVKKGLVIKF